MKIIGLICLSFVLLMSCGGAGDSPAENLSARPVNAVATTSIVADLVKNVGGDRVEVTSLMGPGVDPHLYRAREGDVRRFTEADIIFYNGLHLEAKLSEVLEKMGGTRPTFAVAGGLDPERLITPEGGAGTHDPHVWFDVSLWTEAAVAVRDQLMELDPGHAHLYEENAARYLAELKSLEEFVAARTGEVPEERRVLITAHDAFNYFGQAYGFEVRGIQGISTASEAGTGDIKELADFVAERKIPALFVESSVSPRTIEALQAAIINRGFEVKVGGELYSDALGNPGTPEETYIGIVRHNTDTIVDGLLGPDASSLPLGSAEE